MRRTMTEARDALNEALMGAEERLYAMNLGAPAMVELVGGVHLVWSKVDTKWGLRIRHADQFQPLLSAKLDHRVLAAYGLKGLLVAIRDANDEQQMCVEAATVAAIAFGGESG